MRFSIKTKLIIMLFCVGLIPSSLAVLILYRNSRDTTDEALGLLLLERAEGMAAAVDERLKDVYEETRKIAERIEKGMPPSDALSVLPVYCCGAVILGTGGEVEYRVRGSAGQCADLPLSPPKSEQKTTTTIAEISSAEKLRVLQFSFEVGGGRCLVVFVRSDSLLEPITVSFPGDQTQVAIVSNLRGVIARVPPPEFIVQSVLNASRRSRASLAGWFHLRSLSGEDFIVAYRVSSFLRQKLTAAESTVDWVCVAYMGMQSVVPAFSSALWRIGIFAIGLACLLGGLALVFSGTFLKSLEALHSSVEQIARGNWEQEIRIQTGDEVEDLAVAFSEMLTEIKRFRDALEEQIARVESKARQLELVNQVSYTILGSFNFERLVNTAVEQLSPMLPCSRALLVLVSENQLVVRAAKPPDSRASVTQSLLEDLWNRLRDFKGVVMRDSVAWACEKRNVCCIRLETPDEKLGFLVLETAPQAFIDEEVLTFLAQLAPFLTLAVKHIQLYAQVADFAAELEHKVEERANQLRQAHERLIQNERLAVTGQLAAGVAHEINNPLAIIKNLIQLLRLAPSEQDFVKNLDAMEEELDRIARIVRGLLSFSRPPSLGGPPADVKRELEEVATLLAGSFRKRNIEFTVECDPDLPLLQMSSDHFRQVLINLLRNAEQALEQGGKISVRAFSRKDEAGKSFVQIEVEDNGCGISPENLSHIFEPFFTTKRSKEGVGLGLSVTYGLVTAVGGKIEVSSEPGKGTLFIIQIPIRSTGTGEERNESNSQ